MHRLLILLLIAAALPARAATGYQIHGLALYPKVESSRNYDGTTPGLGLRDDLIVGERDRLFMEMGFRGDFLRDSSFYAGFGYRRRLAGPLHWGGVLQINRWDGWMDRRPIPSLRPQLSLVTDRAALTATWSTRLVAFAPTHAFLFHATVFPRGRTRAGEAPLDGRLPGRDAVEFRFDPTEGLESVGDLQLVWRRAEPGRGGWRAGGKLDVISRDRSGENQGLETTELRLLVERIEPLGARGPLAAYFTFGPSLGYQSVHNHRPDT